MSSLSGTSDRDWSLGMDMVAVCAVGGRNCSYPKKVYWSRLINASVVHNCVPSRRLIYSFSFDKTGKELLIETNHEHFHQKATQMGCVYITYMRLMNSSFCLIWARMNHFEPRLMLLSQKVHSKVFRLTI